MCFETTRPVDNFTGNARIRQRAINKYYENPQSCKYCGEVIKVNCGTKPGDIRVKSFCNHSCSAKYNNAGVRRHPESRSSKCPICENDKDLRAKTCINCKMIKTQEVNGERSIRDLIGGITASRAKFNTIRTLARKAMRLSGRVYKCEYCDFDIKLDVAHIKPIASFDLETKINVVNHLDNLKYMCPNHHMLFDDGYMDVNGVIIKLIIGSKLDLLPKL